MRMPVAMFALLLTAATACRAGGVLPLDETTYLDRASEAVQDGLSRGDLSLAREVATMLEEGAFAELPEVRKTLTRRVLRQLTARLQSLEDRDPALLAELDALRRRIEKAAAAPEPGTSAAPRPIRLPEDEAGHGRIAEWWYMNGHLEDDDGNSYGYELTFFHVRPGIYFVHTGISDISRNEFHYSRRYLRPGQCRISRDRLDLAYRDEWSMSGTMDDTYRIRGMTSDGSSLDLTLEPLKAPMMVNGDGIIDMPEGTFSWYYSLTRLRTSGELRLGDRTVRVKGLSWTDHQWGNFVALRIGWDWFAVQLEDGTDFNIFSFRKGDSPPLAQYVNSLDAEARLTTQQGLGIERLAWWKSPATGHAYVTRYRLTLPDGRELNIESEMDDQEVAGPRFDPAPTYWEGKCRANVYMGETVVGLSYCEQFPYPGGGK